MPEAYNTRLANRLGALALALSDGIREATETATGMAGGLPAALICLHEWADGRSVDVLADAMRLTHSRAVRVVDRLEAAGLARREPSLDDRRRTLVRLESAGHDLAERALTARSRFLRSAVEAAGSDADALERAVGAVLESSTTSVRAARGICRLCDAHACGHYEGTCPVSRAADAFRADT